MEFPEEKIRMRLLIWLSLITNKFGKKMTKSKNSDKKCFDKSVKYIPKLQPGSEVYLDKPPPSAWTKSELLSGEPRYKIQSRTTGTYNVLSETSNFVTIRDDGIQKKVSIDRTKPDSKVN